MEDKEWRFCAVGNVVNEHTDENGKVFYGTKAFVGGTKLYIDDRTYDINDGYVTVIGLNRYNRYVVESVPINLIENVRLQRVFKPKVLDIMDYLERMDGWPWRGRTAEDRRILVKFIEKWNA